MRRGGSVCVAARLRQLLEVGADQGAVEAEARHGITELNAQQTAVEMSAETMHSQAVTRALTPSVQSERYLT